MVRAPRRRRTAAVALLLALAAPACGRSRPRAPAPEDAAFSVGARTVSWGALRGRLARARGGAEASPEDLKRFLQEAVEREMILAEAEALGIGATDEEADAEMRRLAGAPGKDAFEARERELWREDVRARLLAERTVEREVRAGIAVAEEDAERAYAEAAAAGRFRRPERIRARQVFTTSAEAAESARERLERGASFEEAVREFGDDPARGGEMGWIARGTLPEPMDAALFALRPGERSREPVASPYGFHLFEALEREEAREIPPAEARALVRRELAAAAEEKAYRAWIAGLARKRPVAMGKDVR